MVILVTNDDGIDAEGLKALRKSLQPLGRVMVIAPDREQSAMSHSLTLNLPLRVKELEDSVMSVDGTPTDCVLLAMNGLLSGKPDLVVSGINHGPNMGEDIFYSGTVAAAIEGSIQGVPSLAISLAGRPPYQFDVASAFTARLARIVLERQMDCRTILNVNVPNTPTGTEPRAKITRLGKRMYKDVLVRKVDPRGKAYYWIGGDEPHWQRGKDTDFSATEAGMISVTPLQLDLTDYDRIRDMETWNLDSD